MHLIDDTGDEIGVNSLPFRSINIDLSETVQVAGSSSDLWGCNAPQLISIVNSSTFGVALRGINFENADSYPVTVTVDYVKIQVFYNLAGGQTNVAGGSGVIPWWLKGKI